MGGLCIKLHANLMGESFRAVLWNSRLVSVFHEFLMGESLMEVFAGAVGLALPFNLDVTMVKATAMMMMVMMIKR